MKISELLSLVNKKRIVRLSSLIKHKKYHLGMYRAYMVMLYDKGYIEDPTKFKDKAIYRIIDELGVKGMVGVNGRITLSSEAVKYALCKNKDNSEIVDFLYLLFNALKYREYSQSIDKFYDTYSFDTSRNVRVSLALRTIGGRVFSRYAIPVTEAVLNCLIPFDTEVKRISIDEYLWGLAMGKLGVPEEEWGKDGLLSKGLTHSEEINNMKYLLEGNVPLDGIYASKMNSWLFENKWSDNQSNKNNKGLYKVLFIDNIDDIRNKQLELLSEYSDEYIEENLIYYTYGDFYIKKDREYLDLPIGDFVAITEEETVIGIDKNIPEGYSGEVYPTDYLYREGIRYVGCPIELWNNDGKKEFYVDLEQTELSDMLSWFEVSHVGVVFKDGTYEEVKGKDLEEKLLVVYRNASKGKMVERLKYDFTEQELERVRNKIGRKLLKGE